LIAELPNSTSITSGAGSDNAMGALRIASMMAAFTSLGGFEYVAPTSTTRRTGITGSE